jgi:hypothetical protein
MPDFIFGIGVQPIFTPILPPRPITITGTVDPRSGGSSPRTTVDEFSTAIVLAGINNAVQVASFVDQQNWQIVQKIQSKKFKIDKEG